MSNAVTISGSTYTVVGTVSNKETKEGVVDLQVLVYDYDAIGKDDFLGIGVTDATGTFSVSFEASAFQRKKVFDREPDLYFIIEDGGLVLLNTKDNVIQNANRSTPPIHFEVDLSNDKLRGLINETPVAGWVGGFMESNSAFAYPTPDLSSLDMLDNLANIPKLKRQQKVVWPEFSWETEPKAEDPKRCYQMFAPDISRLGYTDCGRIYAIICPQQGAASPTLGSMNVEVTVIGNRGWVDETTKELAADMGVVGKIWFSPSAHEKPIVKRLFNHFNKAGLPFPSSKEQAIVVETYKPGFPDQVYFPLSKGSSMDFPIPDFAKHEDIAWSLGHLGVEIGPIKKTNIDVVDEFNQLVLNIFNTASGNMLQNKNILTWNVWFTAPELVNELEWATHAERWRISIDADHGSPDGDGTIARHYDGTPFQPLKEFLVEEFSMIESFLEKHAISA